MRTTRDPFWRAVLAGLGVVGVVPIAALLITLHDGGRPSAADSEVRARIVHVRSGVDRGDVETLRSIRAIARGRLGTAATTLRHCHARPRTEAWRTCVRWPLAKLAVDGRIAGGMLYGVATGDGLGGCRSQAMGEANTLRGARRSGQRGRAWSRRQLAGDARGDRSRVPGDAVAGGGSAARVPPPSVPGSLVKRALNWPTTRSPAAIV
jgi:hypothetical protein